MFYAIGQVKKWFRVHTRPKALTALRTHPTTVERWAMMASTSVRELDGSLAEGKKRDLVGNKSSSSLMSVSRQLTEW